MGFTKKWTPRLMERQWSLSVQSFQATLFCIISQQQVKLALSGIIHISVHSTVMACVDPL